jgi:hypothetical protein
LENYLIGKQEERRPLERPRCHLNGGKLLKWILKKQEWKTIAEYACCRIRASEGLMWAQY